MKKRLTEAQIVGVLKEAEVGTRVADLSRKYGIAKATFDNWETKFGDMKVSEAQRLGGSLWCI